MIGLLARGAWAGAALLGVLVAALGGASPRLLGCFWGLGTLACLGSGWAHAAERGKKRRDR